MCAANEKKKKRKRKKKRAQLLLKRLACLAFCFFFQNWTTFFAFKKEHRTAEGFSWWTMCFCFTPSWLRVYLLVSCLVGSLALLLAGSAASKKSDWFTLTVTDLKICPITFQFFIFNSSPLSKRFGKRSISCVWVFFY